MTRAFLAHRPVVLVTASREWEDELAMSRRLGRYPRDTILIHGDAPGGDQMADRHGRRKNFRILSIPYFEDGGMGFGGHERNAFLVALAKTFAASPRFIVTVEAFPLPGCRGTFDCMLQAKEAGLTVENSEREP